MTFFLKPLVFVALFGVGLLTTCAVAEPSRVQQRAAIGNWALFCTEGASKPQTSDCSLAAGAVSDIDKNLWVRVGLAFDVEAASAKMTIRIPRTDFFKRLIVIATDADKIGRVSIDECEKDFCRSSVRLDSRNLDTVFNAKMLNVYYQNKRDQGVSLAIDMSGFLPVFGELQAIVGMKKKDPTGDAVATVLKPNASTFIVSLRTPPSGNTYDANLAFGGPATDCMLSSSDLIVKAGNNVQNASDVGEWAAAANRCEGDHVIWINPNFDSSFDNVNLFDKANIARIARVINDRVPNHRLEIVYTNSEGIPFQLTDGK